MEIRHTYIYMINEYGTIFKMHRYAKLIKTFSGGVFLQHSDLKEFSSSSEFQSLIVMKQNGLKIYNTSTNKRGTVIINLRYKFSHFRKKTKTILNTAYLKVIEM